MVSVRRQPTRGRENGLPAVRVVAGDLMIRWLAVLPFAGILVGPFFLNRVQPLVLGMPLLLAWLVMWVVLTAVVMALIYAFDPVNRSEAGGDRRP